MLYSCQYPHFVCHFLFFIRQNTISEGLYTDVSYSVRLDIVRYILTYKFELKEEREIIQQSLESRERRTSIKNLSKIDFDSLQKAIEYFL